MLSYVTMGHDTCQEDMTNFTDTDYLKEKNAISLLRWLTVFDFHKLNDN